ncbi:MAG: LysR family transcriptional regulator [Rhodobacteraceae bacterium]|uniref:LysR substrate-binding domain-containing protein n=1 Tax=Cypionkella sp. TaxID=2811411 RepID=UPI0013225EDD|nr:LysR substrate-binding domain-containing protein [Cypionkella sp.]KAF0172773.1 MAG: LysR family transcriptional regulator [Paracoccaceae bacterium]MDO8327857.1 LysR substrate-binding domain-containing protein [Cypionkella sp.]
MAHIPRLETHLSLRHLILLDAIAREGTLLAASQSVGLTQSAVTKALQEAEATIGTQLFDRTNRGVRATQAGEVLIAHARLVLTQLRHAGQELEDLRSGSGGRVAVGVLVSAAVSILPTAIAAVRQQRPKLAVKVIEGTNDVLMPLLRAGELDLVIGRLPAFSSGSGIAEEMLCEDYAQIVVRKDHPLLAQSGLTLASLIDQPWILPRQETSLRRQIDEGFRQQGLRAPANIVESVSILTNRALVLRSDYLAVWPVQLARFEADLGLVQALDIPLPTTHRPIGISTRRDARLSPAAETLITALRGAASDHGAATAEGLK